MIFNSWDFFVFFVVVYALYLAAGIRITPRDARREDELASSLGVPGSGPRGVLAGIRAWLSELWWSGTSRQNVVLLLASYFFYGWWNWRFLALLFASTLVDFVVAQRIEATRSRGDLVAARRWLLASVVSNLGVLAVFKYCNFFLESLELLFARLGLGLDLPTASIVLPVGISFYTFQTMAYTIDVYRGRIPAARRLGLFALYVSFFPQLVAGPIERAQTLLPQFQRPRRITYDKLASGLLLVFLGLVRKVGIADGAAPVVNKIFSHADTQSSAALLAGVVLFALQIYGDFAGYSSIARGTARLLGFELMENFDHPYFATSIAVFWRKWHISLSTWLRDYLYIPLGGNRVSRIGTYRNLLLTMLLGGLWHGAAWTFVAWGAVHGLALAVHRLWTGGRAPVRPTSVLGRIVALPFVLVSWALTMTVVLVGWVFFRAASFDEAFIVLQGIANWHGDYELDLLGVPFDYGPVEVAIGMTVWTLVIDVPQALTRDETALFRWPWPLRGLVYAIFILLMIAGEKHYNAPFIYFQF